MNIVVTMAGLGMRFRNAGFTIPKYQIKAHGRTLFEWSLLSLNNYRQPNNRYIFIVRREDGATAFIKQTCKKINLSNIFIVELDHATEGQAATAMLAEPHIDLDMPILIHVIDTFIEPDQLSLKDIAGDGFIPCFHAPGDRWSFVRLGPDGRAEEVAEKTRISDNCTVGIYYFRTGRLYQRLYREYYGSGRVVKGEQYVAPLYQHLIQSGGKVYICNVEASKVHELGTPESLSAFKKQPPPSL